MWSARTHGAHVHPALHSPRQRVLKEAGEPRGCDCAALHALQLLPRSQDAAPDPAMEAGIAGHVWTIEELVDILPVETPRKRGPYKKRAQV